MRLLASKDFALHCNASDKTVEELSINTDRYHEIKSHLYCKNVFNVSSTLSGNFRTRVLYLNRLCQLNLLAANIPKSHSVPKQTADALISDRAIPQATRVQDRPTTPRHPDKAIGRDTNYRLLHLKKLSTENV